MLMPDMLMKVHADALPEARRSVADRIGERTGRGRFVMRAVRSKVGACRLPFRAW